VLDHQVEQRLDRAVAVDRVLLGPGIRLTYVRILDNAAAVAARLFAEIFPQKQDEFGVRVARQRPLAIYWRSLSSENYVKILKNSNLVEGFNAKIIYTKKNALSPTRKKQLLDIAKFGK
jgi:hypothetical protein